MISYIASNAIITNPERGFAKTTGSCEGTNIGVSTLQAYRNNLGITLFWCNFYLSPNGPIPQSVLDKLQSQLNNMRTAGLKVILRFGYTKSTSSPADAPLPVVLQHLDQLAPYFRANEDILYVLQAGFIGAWGEWYYTQNYGNLGNMSATDWANRKAIVDKELAVLPASRMIQLRTLQYKQHMYRATALTPGEAFNGSAIARLGHNNDAFVSDEMDMGTYIDKAVDYPYLAADTRYVPMGGESAAYYPARANCSTALYEMELFHWSFVNRDWYPATVQSWIDGGCFDTMRKRVGYRFVMTEGAFANTVNAGGTYPLQLGIRNEGYATLLNARKAKLILRSTTSPSTVFSFDLASNPRFWLPGSMTRIDETITLAGVPAGRYELLLALPDSSSALSTRPEYAIQLANAGTWEPATGFNKLGMTVTVQ